MLRKYSTEEVTGLTIPELYEAIKENELSEYSGDVALEMFNNSVILKISEN